MTATSIPAPTSPKIVTGALVGPASYPAGGFSVDLSATFASVDFFSLVVVVVGPNLPPVHYEVTLNAPGTGQVRVKVMRHRYDRPSAVTGQPAGVSVPAASGALTVAGAGVVSTVANALSVSALGGNVAQEPAHQHSHQHATNILYEHSHTLTQTDAASVELGTVDLSGTTWRYLAVGA